MAGKPSMVHPCTPPPAVEIVELRLGEGDVWTCPTCGDEWSLTRGIKTGGILPASAQRPEWVRPNKPA